MYLCFLLFCLSSLHAKLRSSKLTCFCGFLSLSWLELGSGGSKLRSQVVPIISPSWVKLLKLKPIVIVSPMLLKLCSASCWSSLPKRDSTPTKGLKLNKLLLSRSGSDSGLSLSRSKLFKPDSRLLLLLLLLL